MSQTQLAGRTARVGTDRLSAYVVGQIERTTRQTLDIGDVLALALALDVTPADLLTEVDRIAAIPVLGELKRARDTR